MFGHGVYQGPHSLFFVPPVKLSWLWPFILLWTCLIDLFSVWFGLVAGTEPEGLPKKCQLRLGGKDQVCHSDCHLLGVLA